MIVQSLGTRRGPYRLSLTEGVSDPLPTATPVLALDRTIEGRLEPAETDLWPLDLAQGQVIAIDVEVTEGNLDPWLRLTQSRELVTILTNDLNSTDAHIGPLRIPFSGRYLLRIGGYSNTGGTYKLSIRELLTSPEQPLAQTGELVFGEEIIASAHAGTSYSWRFEGRAGQTVVFRLQQPEGQRWQGAMYLTNSRGTIISSVWLGRESTSEMSLTLIDDGAYVLYIQNIDPDSEVYTLTSHIEDE